MGVKQLTAYEEAGVSVGENEFANEVVKRLCPITYDNRVVADLKGLFSAGYRVDRNRGCHIGQRMISAKNPREISTVLIEALTQIEAAGGNPMFTTDYLAFGNLDGIDAGHAFLEVLRGLRSDGFFLPVIGGEIAEMPGVLKKRSGEFVFVVTYQTEKPTPGTVDISEVEGDDLTASLDSVGTKPKLAVHLGNLNGLFDDMLHHAIGDTVVQNAVPLGMAMHVGMSPAFSQSLTALYNRTMQRSGLVDLGYSSTPKGNYVKGQFDVIGSILGIVNEKDLLTGENIQEGDKLVGYTTFAPNTNGYSLIRRLGEKGLIDYSDTIPGTNLNVGEALLTPHENFQSPVAIFRAYAKEALKGTSHITGGGIRANTERLLPEGLEVQIDRLPENKLFSYLQVRGEISEEDMAETFNRGIGLVFVVDREFDTSNLKDRYVEIGRVVKK